MKASGENLGEEFFAGTQSASAALCISDGNNDVTSEYVPMIAKKTKPLNVIYYTTSDGKTISPKMNNIVENKYEDGQGIITFSDVVTEIPVHAFSGCWTMTSITLPENLTTIDDYAFVSCEFLKSITIPDKVTSIGYEAFQDCRSMTDVTLSESLTTIGDLAFAYCERLTNITIPDNVTTLGNTFGVFGGCKSLTSFSGKYATPDHRCLVKDGALLAFAQAGLMEYTIPDGVTTIGANVFFRCRNLTRLTIPNGVETIAYQAFYECTGLTKIILPESITTIGEGAFNRCSGLTDVYCKPATPPTLGSSVFSSTSVASIHVPQASVEAYKSADGWSGYAAQIVGYDF